MARMLYECIAISAMQFRGYIFFVHEAQVGLKEDVSKSHDNM